MPRSEPTPLFYQIALTLIPGIGDVLAKNLVSYCGSVEAVFKEKQGKLEKIPGIGSLLATQIAGFRDFERVELELAFIEKHKIKTWFYLDENYPLRLRELPDSPVLLYGLGDYDLNPERMVSIVGTRNASEYGRGFVQDLVAELKSIGVTIVSGLAVGIDGAAHRASLDNHLPTIGVLAHGLDRIYPPGHKGLAQKMLKGGGLLTDFKSGTNPDRENFPKRNRIVAGLADVLVLVETGIKGGARITAEIANSYNKEIMAVPGRVSDYYSQGCNYLIKENKAAMLTEPMDLIEWMGWGKRKETKKAKPDLFSGIDEPSQIIITYIRQQVKAELDQMAFDLQLDPGFLSLRLLELEFSGHVRALPGKAFEMA